MAELKFGGRDDPSLPIWLNPNIYLQHDPDDPTPALPTVNQPISILCSVQNAGSQPVAGAITRFYICSPATVPTPGMSQLVGQSFVDLDAGETKEVLCLSPWVPVTSGHFCIICEVTAADDPSPFTADSPWNINDRHIAQHNIEVLQAFSARKRLHMGSFHVPGLANEPYSHVTVRRAKDHEFAATVKVFDAQSNIKYDITRRARFGLLESYEAGDDVPDLEGLEDKLMLKGLKANEQRQVSLAVQLPDGAEQQSAAILFVEQFDMKGTLIGGLAIVAMNIALDRSRTLARQSVAVPVSIPYRPYSTFPETNFMTPDGIFCSNFGVQNINVQVRNDGPSTLQKLSMYVEGVADPNIALTYNRASPPDGSVQSAASFKSVFKGDFSRAASRETLVSFIIQQQSGSSSISTRVIKKIFVLGVEFNKTTKVFTVNVPQGSFQMKINTVIVPEELPMKKEKPMKYPIFIREASMVWVPVPAYAGIHGPLPFEDPWWKILAWIAFVALTVAGAIVAAEAGGEASIGTGGQFAVPDGTVNCCNGANIEVSTDSYVAAGLFTAAAVALGFALADDADPIDKGRVQTPPSSGELTLSERADFQITYDGAPSPGVPYGGKISWQYERTLDSGRILQHSKDESWDNIHYLKGYNVSVDFTPVADSTRPITHPRGKPLFIEAIFTKPNGELFRGSNLYVWVLLWSEAKEKRLIELRDDGSDQNNIDPNIGVYRTSFDMSKEDTARWYLFVFAQDVNTVLEGTEPREAAKTLSGALLTTQFVVGFDDQPCELNHDAVVELT